MSFSHGYRGAIELAVAQQLIALVATAFLLDGGVLLRASLFAIAAHWVVILAVVLRRPLSPTRFDLGLVRFGFIPVGVIASVIAVLMGRGL